VLDGFCEGEEAPYRATARPITAFVERDPRDPDPKRPGIVITGERGKGSHEGFLSDVERLVGVADMAPRKPPDRIPVTSHQRAISRLLTRERAGDERPVLGFRLTHRAG
jgi:hypothetical protein